MYNKNKKILSVKGMHDILPENIHIWELIEDISRNIFNKYGFKKIITPLIESTELFKNIFDNTVDILTKEMYSFQDKLNGDFLSLRPENTISIARAFVEHNLIHNGPKKLWYIGPMFRHEKPQYFRYRQFYQIGVEAIGFIGPDIDAEIIIMCYRILNNLKINNITLELNSIGNINERKKYNHDLIVFLKKYENKFNKKDLEKIYLNPISIFDTKKSIITEIVHKAPKLYNYLNNDSIYHFEEIKKILLYNKIPFKINNFLVRGINYYNKTVFEWKDNSKLYSQNTLCGGGRYDQLINKLGGGIIPACGFAIGMERLLGLIKYNNNFISKNICDIYIIYQGEKAKLKSFVLSELLRDNNINVTLHCNTIKKNSNFNYLIKKVNKNNSKFSIIIGNNEIKNNIVTIKKMKKKNNYNKKQIKIPFTKVVNYFLKKYKLL